MLQLGTHNNNDIHVMNAPFAFCTYIVTHGEHYDSTGCSEMLVTIIICNSITTYIIVGYDNRARVFFIIN